MQHSSADFDRIKMILDVGRVKTLEEAIECNSVSVGNYTAVDILSRDGVMSKVYLGVDDRLYKGGRLMDSDLEDCVAIKVMTHELNRKTKNAMAKVERHGWEEIYDREDRNNLLLAGFPGILPSVKSDKYPNGDFYRIYRYIGPSLQKMLNDNLKIVRPMRFIDIMNLDHHVDVRNIRFNIMSDLIRIVMRLHDNGYCHRDIKPDNIYVTESGRRYQGTLLGDVETAYRFKDMQVPELPLSIAAPDYADVHCLFDYDNIAHDRGDNKSRYIRNDIHAIGVVWYQLVSGHKPGEFHSGLKGDYTQKRRDMISKDKNGYYRIIRSESVTDIPLKSEREAILRMIGEVYSTTLDLALHVAGNLRRKKEAEIRSFGYSRL